MQFSRFGIVLSLIMGLAFVLPAGVSARAADPEFVEIGLEKSKLKAAVFKPPGDGPFPAVVALHGCDGLSGSSGKILSRYQDWADRLVKGGFVVVFPDSFSSRGLGNQCRVRSSLRADRERMADAQAGRAWLQTQPFVKATHVSLLGWSGGAVGVLWTTRPQARVKDDKPDFRSAVAFYPGCRQLNTTAWSTRVPTLILSGALDDVVSSKVCEQMVSGARGRSARATIIIYAGAYHDFDHPTRALQIRQDYARSVSGTGRVHTGANPTARSDAQRRVMRWLSR